MDLRIGVVRSVSFIQGKAEEIPEIRMKIATTRNVESEQAVVSAKCRFVKPELNVQRVFQLEQSEVVRLDPLVEL